MKKRIALFAVACMMFASMGIFAACGEDETSSVGGGDDPSQTQPGTDDPTPSHTHVYGAWEIVTKPTSQQGGKAKRTCNENDDTQELDLPALTDGTFWTKDTTASQAPTHTAAGKNVYKNAEHNLTVEEDVAADADAHDYTGVEWTVKTKPTQTQEGSAERKCTGCDHVDTLTLPNLATTTFWTLDEEASEPATHTAAGKNVYKNAEHNLTVEEDVASTGHVYGAWEWKDGVEPTLQRGATLVRYCTADDEGKEEVPVKSLSDTSEWTAGTPTSATYNEAGTTTYTHKTYTGITCVVESASKLAAVYDDEEYYSFHIVTSSDHRNHHETSSYTGGSWTDAHLRLDGNVGIGSAVPFTNRSKIVFWLVDEATGEMQIRFYAPVESDDETAEGAEIVYEETPSTNIAYLEKESGIIVMSHNAGTDFGSDIDILTPYGKFTTGQATASVWSLGLDFGAVITYTYTKGSAQQSLTMYVTGDKVYFGVELKDIHGAAVTADNAYQAAQLFITKGSETLASVGYKAEGEGGSMVVLDEYVGIYDGGEGELLLDGKGGATLTKDQTVFTGTYAAGEQEGTVGVTYQDGSKTRHFTATLTDGSYTAVFEEAKVTYHVDGNSEATAPEAEIVDKGSPVELPTPADTDSYFFRGWFTDAACETPVVLNNEGKYIAQGDVDLYAKWAQAITIKTQNVYAEGGTVGEEKKAEVSHKVAVGDDIFETVSAYITEDFDEEIGYSFHGWYIVLSGDSRQYLNEQAGAFAAGNENAVFFADWAYTPYVGEYYGHRIYAAYASSNSLHITIAADGTISGDETGKIPTDMVFGKDSTWIRWTADDDTTHYFYYDNASGILVWDGEDSTKQSFADDLAILSKYAHSADEGEIDIHYGLKEKNTASTNYNVQLAKVKTANGEQNVLFYNSKVYVGVTVTDGFGDALEIWADRADTTVVEGVIHYSKTVIIKDASGEIVFSAKAEGNAENFKTGGALVPNEALDGYEGVYTWADHETLKLDGAGDLKLGESKTGAYVEIDKASKKFGLYVVEGNLTVYYEATLGEGTYTSEKIMVDITVNYGEVAEPTNKLAEEKLNKNVKNVLPTLEDPAGTYLFRGWFTDASFENECGHEEGALDWTYTPTGDEPITLYAKWVQKVTITMHHNDEEETVDVVTEYGLNEEIVLERITRDAWVFAGWFTDDEAFTQAWGTFDPSTGSTTVKLTELSYTLYAKWIQPPEYYGVYRLYTYDAKTANGSTDNGDLSKDIFINEDGKSPLVSGATYPFSQNLVITSGPEDGKIIFARESSMSSTFTTHFNSATKIMVFIARGTNPQGYDDIVILIPVAMAEGATVTGAQWESGTIRVINIHTEESDYGIYLKTGEDPHFGVSFVDMNDSAVTDLSNAHQAVALRIKSGDEIIARYGYDGETMVALDGNEGAYTLSGSTIDELPNTLTLNGVSTATFGEEKVGSYEVVSDTVVGIYVDGAYYEATLNKDADTYTLVKPMISVTFHSDNGLTYGDNQTLQNGEYNKNIEVHLPVLSDTATHVFRGWYTTEDFQEDTMLTYDEDGYYLFKPTGNEAITLHAKWLEKVTVKVHYQKGGVEDVTLELGKGEEAYPAEPPYTDGQVFKAWHLGAADGDVWASGSVVNADITIYCEWQDAVPMFGEWTGTEIFGSTNGGGTTYGGSTSKSVTVSPLGSMSGEKSGTITDWDETTGTFKVGSRYGAFDMKNGVLIVTDGTSKIGSDYHVFINKSISTSFTTSSSAACYWNGSVNGSTKLAEMTLANGSKMIIFIYEGRVWGKVTFEGTPIDGFSDALTAGNVWQKAQSLVIKDSDGKVIASFVRSANGLELSDGFDGTYTGTKGEEEQQDLLLDGKGAVTWAGRQGTYAPQEGAENTIEIYLEASGEQVAEYWVVTLVKGDANTYTATMPMVQLTLVLRDEAGANTLETVQKSVNKNIPFALSATHEELVSAGWYTDETLQEAVTLDENGLYKPTEEATLYAKMVGKVKLTIVYGTEHGNLPNAEIELPKGNTPDLTEYVPKKQGDYVFGGWYEDEACEETPYEVGPLNESKTIYCKWIEQQFDIESVNLEYNKGVWKEVANAVWKIEGEGSQNKAAIKITFKASGTFTFDWECSISSFNSDYFAYQVNPSDGKMVWYYGTQVTKANGSGSASITVEEGQTLYIGYYNFSSASSSDYAQVSNFKLVAG